MMLQRSLRGWRRLGLLLVLVGGLCAGLGCKRDQADSVDEETTEEMRQQPSTQRLPIVEKKLPKWKQDLQDLLPVTVDEATMEEMRQQRSALMSLITEGKLTKWEPDHEDLVPMISDIHKPDVEIAGSWTTLGGFSGSTLEIQEDEDGTYSIDFSTGGCLSDWDLKRTGTYANGVLRLDKPVEEYISSPYDALYPVRVGGLDYLISQWSIRFLSEHYATDGKVKWVEHIDDHAFHRESVEKTQPERNETMRRRLVESLWGQGD